MAGLSATRPGRSFAAFGSAAVSNVNVGRQLSVTPVEAGVQARSRGRCFMDSGLRRNNEYVIDKLTWISSRGCSLLAALETLAFERRLELIAAPGRLYS